ncbi:MAG: MBL fold metallo-hydrolase [Deltaproteobacteria bacterium]|nr:MBL fold metallo-hydrolase [Deltaproteobacteria bacterium]
MTAPRLATIVDAELGLDGGMMMGVVPRPLWETVHPPDERNRIRLVSRCGVFSDAAAGRLWLFDVGVGRDWGAKSQAIYDFRYRGPDLRALLAGVGYDPDAVTDVLLSHLHFDHAGGIVVRGAAGAQRLAFPRARHHVQAAQWAWARAPTVRDAGSFRPDHLAVLEASGRLDEVDGPRSLDARVSVRVVSGHTPGMQLAQVRTDDGEALFLADLVPVWSHVRLPWITAHDHEPLRTIEDKRALLREAAEHGTTLLSGHDPSAPRARVRTAGDDMFEVETFATAEDR